MLRALMGYRCCQRMLPVLAAVAVYANLATEVVAQGSFETDQMALEAFYDATGGPTWWNSTNWKTNNTPLRAWYGVVTGDDGRVVYLGLSYNRLTGPIPDVLGSLSKLQSLDLDDNELTGPIPDVLGSLSDLLDLHLENTELTGPIPDALGDLSKLEWLNLSNNELTGPIPDALGNLSNLITLELGRNGLTGPIPEVLGSLSNLITLALGANGLTGPIPDALGSLSNLKQLSFWRNELTGPVPAWLENLTNLELLSLGWNGLTGPIPAWLGSLTNLVYLDLYNNELTGPIPDALGNLSNLKRLYLGGNALTGPIPAWLESLTNLEWLLLDNGELTGPVPAWLGSLTNLVVLRLDNNELTGPLPSELIQLTRLRRLNIENTGLCAPPDSAFQEWLATIEDFVGSMCPQVPGSFSIPDRGGQSITSGGTAGTVQVGYGAIRAGAGSTTPSGIAIFQFRDSEGVLISEAGVPAAAPVLEGRIFAEVNGSVNTGLAIANPNDGPAFIQFYFTDTSGTRFAEGSFDLGAHEQTAKFLDQPPFNGGGSVLGTLTFTSSVPIAVVALRGLTNEAGEFLMTTLPVSPVSSTDSDSVYFSHFADGSGWATQVILVNPTDRTITGTVAFLGQGSDTASAAPVVLALDDGSTGSNFDYSIAPRSAQRFTTADPPGGPAVGSVRATPNSGNAAPSGLVVFSFVSGGKTVSEAGVPALPKGSAFRVYVEASGMAGQVGSIRSGLAIANTGDTANTVTLEVTHLDGSLAVPPETLALPPSGQIARFLDEIFALPDNFSGVVRVTSTAEVAIVGLRLRVNEREELKVTTTPPFDETDPATTAETFFPHIVDSGGWSTQFILFSGTAGQASSGTLRFIDASGQPLDLTIAQP